MGICDDPNTDLYGTYSDYHPEIARQKTMQDLEEEIAELSQYVEIKGNIYENKDLLGEWNGSL